MMSDPKIGVAIPSITPRTELLKRALESVYAQTYPVSSIAVAVDHDHMGAGHTRNRAKNMLLADPTISHIAFLDDDDILKPNHIEDILGTLLVTGKDLVFPWCDVLNGTDPLAELENFTPWNDETPHSFFITTLMTAEAARSTDFGEGYWEDWHFFKELLSKGFQFVHHYARTFYYDHGSNNTSGLGSRW